MKALFSLLTLLWATQSYAQRFDCLDAATRVQLADSIKMLADVRKSENAQFDLATRRAEIITQKDVQIADLNRAYDAMRASEEQRGIQANAAAEQAIIWKRKAKARSIKIGGIMALFVGYVVIRK